MESESKPNRDLPLITSPDFSAISKRPSRRWKIVGLILLLIPALLWLLMTALRQYSRSYDYAGRMPLRKWNSSDSMHAYFVDRFVASDGFGGFRMPRTRTVSTEQELKLGERTFLVTEMDLISLGQGTGLTKHYAKTPPFAYDRTFESTKALLVYASHRPLLKTESDAIQELVAGKNTVFANGDSKMLIVGAVRATESCQQCHKVAVGELLGAFTYTLVPSPYEN